MCRDLALSGETRIMETKTACAYWTSSATNVGQDRDSPKRQTGRRPGLRRSPRSHDHRRVQRCRSIGRRPCNDRLGFSEMLAAMLGNCARIMLIENASRFARDPAVQIAGRGRPAPVIAIDHSPLVI